MALTESELHDLQNLMQAERFDDAIAAARSMVRQNPDVPLLHNVMGVAMMQSGRRDEAPRAFQRAVDMAPDYVEAVQNLASALVATGRLDEAEEPIRSALHWQPDDAVMLRNLASLLVTRGDWDEAESVTRQALALEPRHSGALLMLASVQQAKGQGSDALKTLAGIKGDAEALLLTGEIRAMQGETAAARDAFEAVLAINPDQGFAWGGLATLATAEDAAALIARLEARRAETGSDETRMHLDFALAQALAKAGRPAEVFAPLNAAQAWRRARAGSYSHARRRKEIGRIKTTLPAEAVAALSSGHAAAPRPVFLLGLPGAGQALLAKALARHPAVADTGADTAIDALGRALLAAPRSVDARRLRDEAEAMTARQAAKAGVATLALDTASANVDWVGLILAMHPEAALIRVQRDPRAMALSIYGSNLAGAALPWAHDLEEIASQLAQSEELMDHWQAQYPDRVVTCRYEDLRADPEAELRRLAGMLTLSWDPAMLPDASARAEEPLGDWRTFEADLAPFTAAMARFGRPL